MKPILPIAQYMGRTKDGELLLQSTSGGAFTELARVVLREGGVVFGVAWDERFRAVHKWTETELGLGEMRGSKYVVSDMSGVWKPMREFLNEGRKVFFVGTPCQTAAVNKVFGVNQNLILCALICMANIEPKRWERYVVKLERFAQSRIKSVHHRFKIRGNPSSFFKVEFEDDSTEFIEPLKNNEYLRGLGDRPRRVCRSCRFRSGRHCADLQIGDFWGAKKWFPDIDDTCGVSAILAYSSRGIELLKKTKLRLSPVNYEQILSGNPYLEKQPVLPKKVSLIQRVGSRLLRIVRQLGRHRD